jgi:hypothetical protein
MSRNDNAVAAMPPFRVFVETAALLRWTYIKEQFRTSPVSSGLWALVIAVVVLQALGTLANAFTPLPAAFAQKVHDLALQYTHRVLGILPIMYVVRQVIFPPFLMQKSNMGFFRLFPIPNRYVALMRWSEGGLSISEITITSFLLLLFVWQTQDAGIAIAKWLMWIVLVRTLTQTLYEVYCLISDTAWVVFLLYLGVVFWLMVEFTNFHGLAVLTPLAMQLDTLLLQFPLGLAAWMGIVGVLFFAGEMLFSFRMKKMGIVK